MVFLMSKRIFDKIFLFSIGVLLLSTQEATAGSVAVCLIALTFTALSLYFDDRRAAVGSLSLCGVLCLFFPALLFFLPVICYDGFWHCFLWCFACALPVILQWERFPLPMWLIILSALAASALLACGTKRNDLLSAELIRLRDTATERDMLQQSRNRQLLEKQDYEIWLATLQVGAKGYILKQDYEGIVPALHAVQGGQNVFGGEIVQKTVELIGGSEEAFDFAAYDISEREQAVIEQVAQGLNNREIAEELCLSEGTVRNYISIVLEKLSLRDRTQLAVFYYQKVKKRL